MGPKSNDSDSYKGREREIWTQRHRQTGEGQVTLEAETGVMYTQAKHCQEPPGTQMMQGEFFPRAFRGNMILPTP